MTDSVNTGNLQITTLIIDEQGRIELPDWLIRRLCMTASVSVPLVRTDVPAYLMPSAFTAMLIGGMGESGPVSCRDEDEDISEEETDRMIEDFRYGKKEG